MTELLESIDPEAFAQLAAEEQRNYRRAMMVSQIALGKDVLNAARAVAKKTGQAEGSIRNDWYKRYAWGPEFFNLNSPENIMVDILMKVEGLDAALKYEYAQAMPQSKVERDTDGSPLRDGKGEVIRHTEDKQGKRRIGILRARKNLMAWAAEFIQKVGILPQVIQPGRLSFDQDVEAKDAQVMDIEEARSEFEELDSKLARVEIGKQKEIEYANEAESKEQQQEEKPGEAQG